MILDAPGGNVEAAVRHAGAVDYDEWYGTHCYASRVRRDDHAIRGMRVRCVGVPIVTFESAEALLAPYAPLIEGLSKLPSHAKLFHRNLAGTLQGGRSEVEALGSGSSSGDSIGDGDGGGDGAADAESALALVPPQGEPLSHPLAVGSIVEAKWGGQTRTWLAALVLGANSFFIDGLGDDDDSGGEGGFEIIWTYRVAYVADGEVEDGVGAQQVRPPSTMSALDVRRYIAKKRGDDQAVAQLDATIASKEKRDASGDAVAKRKRDEKAAKTRNKQRADAASQPGQMSMAGFAQPAAAAAQPLQLTAARRS